jgi:hypothetical protein
MGAVGWSFRSFGVRLVALIVIATAGFAAWLMLPEPSGADNKTASVSVPFAGSTQEATLLATTTDNATAAPTGQATQEQPLSDPASAASSDAATVEPAPIEGLKIAAQSWRRGGLGSKALVTLTLRNTNGYAVKDIEIACAFARADGSHLTDRRRTISDTINMKSRKTYAGMLVGFVNVNANKARCSLVAASRA